MSRHTEGQLLLHTVRIIDLNGMAGSIACIANDAPVTCLLHKIAVYKLLALLPFCICRESWMEDAILNAREVIEVNRKAVRIIASSAARLRTLFFLK